MTKADFDGRFATAVEQLRAGRFAEAETLCRELLAGVPEEPRLLHLLGTIRHSRGEAGQAIDLVNRAVQVKPDYAEAHFNLAAMLATAERLEEAAHHFQRAAALKPENVEAHARAAAALMNLERRDEAEAAFRRVLALRPDYVSALVDLSTLTLARGEAGEAIELARRAVALAPRLPEAHVKLGRALKELQFYDEALQHYHRALELDPDVPEVENFLAVALMEIGRLEEAQELCRRVLARDPDEPRAHCTLGIVAQALGDPQLSLSSCRRSMALRPDNAQYARNLAATVIAIPGIGERERFAEQRHLGRIFGPDRATALGAPTNDPDPDRRLRIGWLSSDLRGHPVGRNLHMLFLHWDRNRFEHHLYAEVTRPDEITDWFRGQADGWCFAPALGDAELAERIRADRIDVMLYLAGRFDHNRPEVAAWRPAPVQMSFHEPATSGLVGMDYLISDRCLSPRGGAELYTERPLRLPSFYLHGPVEDGPSVAPLPYERTGTITFGSYNNPTKTNPGVLACWAEVLRRVPGSRLVLKYKNRYTGPTVSTRIRDTFAALGIDPARIETRGETEDMAAHLDNYARIDIALDTFPFTGSTTTFEALWMGVPVVTLAGPNMVSRWSASILRTVGLKGLIAETPAAYADIAARLAADPRGLAELRSTLRQRVLESPVCDGGLRARQMERLFRAAWRRWCASAA
jgi:protein O-GlcNAc transferase